MRILMISIGILLLPYINWNQPVCNDLAMIRSYAGEGESEERNPEELDPSEITNELLNEYDFSELDRQLHEVAGMEAFDFEELVRLLLQGDVGVDSGNMDGIIQLLYQTFLSELNENRAVMLRLLILAIFMAVFTSLSGSSSQGAVSENGYYVTYLVMAVLFLSAYRTMYSLAYTAFDDILKIMYALIPTYIVAISYSSGVTSAAVMEDGLILAMTMISRAVKEVIFPAIHLYFSLGLMDQLMKREFFSRWSELIATSVKWLLKTILALTVGLNTVKSMLAPAVDSVTATALQRGLQVIPGGDAAAMVSGVMLGSGVLIKNAIGAGGICVLTMAVSIPVLKLAAIILLYKLMGAMLQPIADRRMLQGLQTVDQSGQMMIAVLLTEITLFLLSIAIIAGHTNTIIHGI